MEGIKVIRDYDYKFVPEQIAIITDGVQKLSDSYEAEIQSLEARIESLQAQLAQAEDACHQMQTEHSATDAVKAVRLEIAEEIENHSYLAGTHEMCVWIDSLTKRLHEEAKEKNVTP